MVTVHCRICKKKFMAKPSWIKKGHGIYCSAICQYVGMKKGKMMRCFICGKESYKQKKALTKSKSKKFFCSKSCQTRWRNTVFVGSKHANWVHGRNAYRNIMGRNKVVAVCTLCETTDKRVLAVHHIDRDRMNNKLKNLAYLCHNCHFLVHHDIRERRRFVMKRG